MVDKIQIHFSKPHSVLIICLLYLAGQAYIITILRPERYYSVMLPPVQRLLGCTFMLLSPTSHVHASLK